MSNPTTPKVVDFALRHQLATRLTQAVEARVRQCQDPMSAMVEMVVTCDDLLKVIDALGNDGGRLLELEVNRAYGLLEGESWDELIALRNGLAGWERYGLTVRGGERVLVDYADVLDTGALGTTGAAVRILSYRHRAKPELNYVLIAERVGDDIVVTSLKEVGGEIVSIVLYEHFTLKALAEVKSMAGRPESADESFDLPHASLTEIGEGFELVRLARSRWQTRAGTKTSVDRWSPMAC